jgi:hypothetical protein
MLLPAPLGVISSMLTNGLTFAQHFRPIGGGCEGGRTLSQLENNRWTVSARGRQTSALVKDAGVMVSIWSAEVSALANRPLSSLLCSLFLRQCRG